MQRSIDASPVPGFSLKCGYFLTDTHEAGMANTWIVPGRHMDAALETPEGNVGQPADAIPFAAPANSCCIFDRRLWHSATPNWSQVTRKVSAAAVRAPTAAATAVLLVRHGGA